MPLTPDDIVNYPLKQSMRGYAVDQVDELLDQVADELERLYRELDDTRRRLERAETRVESVSETEMTLKRTLVTAQRAAEQTLEDARNRAAGIVADAEEEAERVRSAATRDLRGEVAELTRLRDRLDDKVEQLRRFESTYRDNLRELLDRHRRTLEELEDTTEPTGYDEIVNDPSLDELAREFLDDNVWPEEAWTDPDVWRRLSGAGPEDPILGTEHGPRRHEAGLGLSLDDGWPQEGAGTAAAGDDAEAEAGADEEEEHEDEEEERQDQEAEEEQREEDLDAEEDAAAEDDAAFAGSLEGLDDDLGTDRDDEPTDSPWSETTIFEGGSRRRRRR